MAEREPHYLDESLQAVIGLPCDSVPSEVARVLINLCGAVRALERQNEALTMALAGATADHRPPACRAAHPLVPAAVGGAL